MNIAKPLTVEFHDRKGWCIMRGPVVIASKFWTRNAAEIARRKLDRKDTP